MARKTKVVMNATYYDKDGPVPAGKAVSLPDKEASALIDQGLAYEYVAEPDPRPAESSRVSELEQELAALKADCKAKLDEAQAYAESLEARLAEQETGTKDGK